MGYYVCSREEEDFSILRAGQISEVPVCPSPVDGWICHFSYQDGER